MFVCKPLAVAEESGEKKNFFTDLCVLFFLCLYLVCVCLCVCVYIVVSLFQTLLSYFIGEQGRIVWDLTSIRSGNGSGFGGARAALVDVSKRVE
jgi:hypothetical protein